MSSIVSIKCYTNIEQFLQSTIYKKKSSYQRENNSKQQIKIKIKKKREKKQKSIRLEKIKHLNSPDTCFMQLT